MSMRDSDLQTTETAETAPRALVCTRCGGGTQVLAWQPRLRCPHCGVLGYSDRAGLNLLPLAWDCPTCGASNNGMTNFCLACGAGLSSRCLRCETPVYSVLCPYCSAHQARQMHMRTVESQRATWVPLIQAHIQEQRSQQAQATVNSQRATYGVAGWREIDRDMRDATQQRRARHTRTQPRGRLRWGLIWILGGTLLLLWEPLKQGLDALFSGDVQAALFNLVEGICFWAQTWWQRFEPTLGRLDEIRPSDPEFAYLFATLVFSLAFLPICLHLIRSVLHHLFP